MPAPSPWDDVIYAYESALTSLALLHLARVRVTREALQRAVGATSDSQASGDAAATAAESPLSQPAIDPPNSEFDDWSDALAGWTSRLLRELGGGASTSHADSGLTVVSSSSANHSTGSVRIFPTDSAALDVLDALAHRQVGAAQVAIGQRWLQGLPTGSGHLHALAVDHPAINCQRALNYALSIAQDAANDASVASAVHPEGSFPLLRDLHEDVALAGHAREDALNIEWIRSTAEDGAPGAPETADAQLQYGELLMYGYPAGGLRPDPMAAARMFRRAADAGGAEPLARLGMLLLDGGLGVDVARELQLLPPQAAPQAQQQQNAVAAAASNSTTKPAKKQVTAGAAPAGDAVDAPMRGGVEDVNAGAAGGGVAVPPYAAAAAADNAAAGLDSSDAIVDPLADNAAPSAPAGGDVTLPQGQVVVDGAAAPPDVGSQSGEDAASFDGAASSSVTDSGSRSSSTSSAGGPMPDAATAAVTELARQYLEQASAGGSVTALAGLGYMYQTGQGVPRNMSKAAEYLQRAADGGLLGAHSNLAALYLMADPNDPLGLATDGVVFNATKAREHLNVAVTTGFAPAHYNLGLIDYYGWDRDGVQDCAAAMSHWMPVAIRGRWADEGPFSIESALDQARRGDPASAQSALMQYLVLSQLGLTSSLDNAAFLLERRVDVSLPNDSSRRRRHAEAGNGSRASSPQAESLSSLLDAYRIANGYSQSVSHTLTAVMSPDGASVQPLRQKIFADTDLPAPGEPVLTGWLWRSSQYVNSISAVQHMHQPPPPPQQQQQHEAAASSSTTSVTEVHATHDVSSDADGASGVSSGSSPEAATTMHQTSVSVSADGSLESLGTLPLEVPHSAEPLHVEQVQPIAGAVDDTAIDPNATPQLHASESPSAFPSPEATATASGTTTTSNRPLQIDVPLTLAYQFHVWGARQGSRRALHRLGDCVAQRWTGVVPCEHSTVEVAAQDDGGFAYFKPLLDVFSISDRQKLVSEVASLFHSNFSSVSTTSVSEEMTVVGSDRFAALSARQLTALYLYGRAAVAGSPHAIITLSSALGSGELGSGLALPPDISQAWRLLGRAEAVDHRAGWPAALTRAGLVGGWLWGEVAQAVSGRTRDASANNGGASNGLSQLVLQLQACLYEYPYPSTSTADGNDHKRKTPGAFEWLSTEYMAMPTPDPLAEVVPIGTDAIVAPAGLADDLTSAGGSDYRLGPFPLTLEQRQACSVGVRSVALVLLALGVSTLAGVALILLARVRAQQQQQAGVAGPAPAAAAGAGGGR